jgi:hypothetical protein
LRAYLLRVRGRRNVSCAIPFGTLTLTHLLEDRYIWAAALSRAIMAALVAVIALVKVNDKAWKHLADNMLLYVMKKSGIASRSTEISLCCRGAIVSIAFVAQFGIDQLLAFIAVRRHWWRRRRPTNPTDPSDAAVDRAAAEEAK